MICWQSARLIAGVCFITLLAACAAPQTAALRGASPTGIPARAELEQVVFYPQEEHQCGPSSLAMVLQHAGRDIEPDQLTPFLYLPGKQGSLQAEMLAAARRHRLLAYVLEPELQYILTEVASGNPVLVLQNLGLNWYPVWHYAVVIGYDVRSEEIILRSGTARRQVVPFSVFENTWARGAHWAMVAVPPEKIPRTAGPEGFIQSANALARTSPGGDVRPAYDAAMLRWPGSLMVKIAAGNFAYQNGLLSEAHAIFRQAAQEHPDSVAAFNNLAQTLSDLGEHEAALLAARHAVDMGGALNAQARSTLAEIEKRIAADMKK
jgi:tetratricopeptide (TPR) repeat protein